MIPRLFEELNDVASDTGVLIIWAVAIVAEPEIIIYSLIQALLFMALLIAPATEFVLPGVDPKIRGPSFRESIVFFIRIEIYLYI